MSICKGSAYTTSHPKYCGSKKGIQSALVWKYQPISNRKKPCIAGLKKINTNNTYFFKTPETKQNQEKIHSDFFYNEAVYSEEYLEKENKSVSSFFHTEYIYIISFFLLLSGLLTPVTPLNAQNPVRAAQTEQTSEGTQDDDKYMTLTCVVKNETEPTSERRYNFIAYSTDKETGEKKMLSLANKDSPNKGTNIDMDNMIDKKDELILKIERTEQNLNAYKEGGLYISLENIQSINGFKVTDYQTQN